MLGLVTAGLGMAKKVGGFLKGSGLLQKGGAKGIFKGNNTGIFGGRLKNALQNIQARKIPPGQEVSPEVQAQMGGIASPSEAFSEPRQQGISINADYPSDKPSMFKNSDGSPKWGLIGGIGLVASALIFAFVKMVGVKKGGRR